MTDEQAMCVPPAMTDQQAIELIEGICGDDFCEELAMLQAGKQLAGDLNAAAGKLMDVYVIAHAFAKNHGCRPVHGTWRADTARMYAELVASR